MKTMLRCIALVLPLLLSTAYGQMPSRTELKDPAHIKTARQVTSAVKKKNYRKAGHAILANPFVKKRAGRYHAGLGKAVDLNGRKQFASWKKAARKNPEAFARKKYAAARKRDLLAFLE